MYYYKRAEKFLWTVGIDTATGWQTDSDHSSKEEAAQRVAFLNGGGAETARKLTEAEAKNAEAQIAELLAVLHGCNEWFTLHASTANIRKPCGKSTPAVMTIRDAIARAGSQQPHTA